jgi:hypothetical protein
MLAITAERMEVFGYELPNLPMDLRLPFSRGAQIALLTKQQEPPR